MDQLFASPLKSMPNGVGTQFNTPAKRLFDDDDDHHHMKSKKFYPIFERSAGKRLSSTPSPSSASLKKKRKYDSKTSRKHLPFINSNKQYSIDAGQKDFDASRCKTCNMLYTMGEVTDETHHAHYHDTFVNSLKFFGWKNEDVIERYDDDASRVVRVLPKHRKYSYMHKKIDDVFTVADLELGIRVNLKTSMKESSVYLLYVRDKRIAGFVAAEQITCANHLISEEPLMVCTDEEPAECGIARLWTHPKYRRQKIACRLLDSLRMSFAPGKVIERSQIAFSDPTNNGIEFAKYYTGMFNFFIFQYQPIQ